jgi:subtilase family serine protease
MGYGPADLQRAYNLPSATAGAGQSVAIVTAFDDPNAVSDLAAYRAAWGLPPCDPATGAGCLTKVNQYGNPSPLPAPAGTSGWATEDSEDLDMVAAICPLCHIILVEANKPIWFGLGHAVNSAVRLGARYVDNPYIALQYFQDPNFDSMYYQHPGDAIVAAAGTTGYFIGYPAASQYVTAVGGTSLLPDTTITRGWSEHVWGSATSKLGTGSGCASKFEPKPPWQTPLGCARRTDNDVSAIANPHDGVAVYDTSDQQGWFEAGGTGVSASIITAVYALAGPPAPGTYPASYLYANPQALFDVTIGSNGICSHVVLCNAQPGYDGPSGLGTPDGIYAFAFHG